MIDFRRHWRIFVRGNPHSSLRHDSGLSVAGRQRDHRHGSGSRRVGVLTRLRVTKLIKPSSAVRRSRRECKSHPTQAKSLRLLRDADISGVRDSFPFGQYLGLNLRGDVGLKVRKPAGAWDIFDCSIVVSERL